MHLKRGQSILGKMLGVALGPNLVTMLSLDSSATIAYRSAGWAQCLRFRRLYLTPQIDVQLVPVRSLAVAAVLAVVWFPMCTQMGRATGLHTPCNWGMCQIRPVDNNHRRIPRACGSRDCAIKYGTGSTYVTLVCPDDLGSVEQ